jgi:hypothetical protein
LLKHVVSADTGFQNAVAHIHPFDNKDQLEVLTWAGLLGEKQKDNWRCSG